MVELTIRDGAMRYCGQMVRHLRREHQVAFAAIGLNAHRELRNTMSQSSYRRAAFLDGRLAALWGCTGTTLSPHGFAWLCLTNEAAAKPMMVLREARRQLNELMVTKSELVTTVLPEDQAAFRLCAFLGFHAGKDSLAAYSKWGRRTLMEHVRNNSDLRVTVGNSYVIHLGYHGEQAMVM